MTAAKRIWQQLLWETCETLAHSLCCFSLLPVCCCHLYTGISTETRAQVWGFARPYLNCNANDSTWREGVWGSDVTLSHAAQTVTFMGAYKRDSLRHVIKQHIRLPKVERDREVEFTVSGSVVGAHLVSCCCESCRKTQLTIRGFELQKWTLK